VPLKGIKKQLGKKYRHLQRYREIVNVLVKHGFGHLVQRMRLSRYTARGRRKVYREEKRLSWAARVRLVCEELGPTFIKMGQVLSTRPDLIPLDFIEEFQKLQDRVPSFAYERVKEEIQGEIGAPVEKLFATFQKRPLAAASIGQVHSAQIESGQKVIVKVQRPGIEEVIETDLNILFNLAQLLERYVKESRLYRPVGIVEEFKRTIEKEMDYTIEGRNVERFSRNFAQDETVYIPKVYWELTSKRILTLELIEGIKISEIKKIEKAGLDKKRIARNGANAVLKQIFIDGFFHADPHPGNIFVLKNEVIAFMDFGMVGYIDQESREKIGNLFLASIEKDVDKVIDGLSDMGIIDERVALQDLRSDILELMEKYYGVPLKELEMGKIINEMIALITKHRIKVPPNFMLLGKALVTIEGVGKALDPEFDMITHTKPFATKLWKRRMEPARLAKDLVKVMGEFNELIRMLPRESKQILKKIQKGELKIGLEHKGLRNLISGMDRVSNRISFSLIIAALIVGSSIIMQTDKGPIFMGFPVLGILGYIIAGILGLWLVITILWSKRL